LAKNGLNLKTCTTKFTFPDLSAASTIALTSFVLGANGFSQ